MEAKYCSLHLSLNANSLRSFAGMHDFERALISPEHIDSMVVSQHEITHDKFLLETVFGNAQFAFKQLSECAHNSRVRRNAGLWVETMFNASQTAHECGATYLAIKWFSRRLEKEILHSHPVDYQQYFMRLSSVIDSFFGASFVQYIVGKIIVEVCLASTTFHKLAGWNLAMPVFISLDEQPDYRLQTLLPKFKERVDELLSLLDRHLKNVNETGPAKFDFQQEAAWLSLSTPESRRLEREIHLVVRNWIYVLADELWPCTRGEELPQITRRFLDNVAVITGIDLNQRGFWTTTEIEDSAERFRLTRALRGGTTNIDNSSVGGRVKPRPLDDTTNPITIFTHPPGNRVFITGSLKTPQLSDLSWNRFVFEKNRNWIIADRLSHRLFKSGLAARNCIACSGLPIPSADLMIVGLHSDRLMLRTSCSLK